MHDNKPSDYKLLEWSGPHKVSVLKGSSVPNREGLYVITNSSSPFAFRAIPNHLKPGMLSAELPQILYVGMAVDLRARMRHYSPSSMSTHLQHRLSGVPDLYVYWAVADKARKYEHELIADVSPLLNGVKNKLATAVSPASLLKLERMLANRVAEESEYQSFFERNPWVFGLQFSLIESHGHFDNENIPDFTGVRSRDGTRDILEIKQPFLTLQKRDGSPNSEFHDVWAQAERYLDFARSEAGYLLRQKNLRFENPYCYLILGYEPDLKLRGEILRKQRMNPSVIVITYDQVLRMAHETIRLIPTVLKINA